MIRKIQQLFSGFSEVAGLEIILLPEGKSKINYSLLVKENNLIIVKEQVNGIVDVKSLSTIIKTGTPVSLIVNGRGIVYRKIRAGEDKDDFEIITEVLPNLNPSDFYLQEFISDEDDLYLSIIRKDIIEQYLYLFKELGIKIIHISLGPYLLTRIKPLLKQKEEIIASGHQLSFENNELRNHTILSIILEEDFWVGDDKIKGESLLSFTAAITCFVSFENLIGLKISGLKEQFEEIRYQNIFKTVSYFLLGFFFIILAINYTLYSWLNNENNQLASKRYTYQSMLKKIDHLEKEVQEKEYFLKTAGWFSLPRTSYYADKIALLNPEKIKLNEMNINPLSIKASRKEKQLRFQSDTIYVKGICSNPIVLNPWIDKLKSEEWVNSLSNINYQYDNQKNVGYFEIEIRLNDKF